MAVAYKPYKVRKKDLVPGWRLIDAEGQTLGRLSSEIAGILQGKHNPLYVRHMCAGDFVIVVNAEKIKVTGKKMGSKVYYRHSGYHGGLKEVTLERMLETYPERVIQHAVKGMLPKNALGRRMLKRLKAYAGPSHPHQAQVASAEDSSVEQGNGG